MKFIIDEYRDDFKHFWYQSLTYYAEEHSFYMQSVVDKINIELIINKISMHVSSNIIVNINGFCGLNKSMQSNIQVPKSKKGIIKVEHNLKFGFAYSIFNNYDDEFPILINSKSGWVCIGDPNKKVEAVEFLKNCIAVIDNGVFISLWLKPDKLPIHL